MKNVSKLAVGALVVLFSSAVAAESTRYLELQKELLQNASQFSTQVKQFKTTRVPKQDVKSSLEEFRSAKPGTESYHYARERFNEAFGQRLKARLRALDDLASTNAALSETLSELQSIKGRENAAARNAAVTHDANVYHAALDQMQGSGRILQALALDPTITSKRGFAYQFQILESQRKRFARNRRRANAPQSRDFSELLVFLDSQGALLYEMKQVYAEQYKELQLGDIASTAEMVSDAIQKNVLGGSFDDFSKSIDEGFGMIDEVHGAGTYGSDSGAMPQLGGGFFQDIGALRDMGPVTQ